MLIGLLGQTAGAILLFAAAGLSALDDVGLLTSWRWSVRRLRSPAGSRPKQSVTLSLGAFSIRSLGVGFGIMATLSMVGYLVADILPIAAIVIVARTVWTHRSLRWPVGVPLAIGIVLVLVLGRDAPVCDGPSRHVRPSISPVSALKPAVPDRRRTVAVDHGDRLPGRWACSAGITRHRRLFTVIAALACWPYALACLTWLRFPESAPPQGSPSPQRRSSPTERRMGCLSCLSSPPHFRAGSGARPRHWRYGAASVIGVELSTHSGHPPITTIGSACREPGVNEKNPQSEN